MSVAVAAPSRTRARRPADCSRPTASAGGRLTLDELVSSAWAGLSAGAPVACPACGGRMSPEPAGAGRCRECAATLS
jgi:hypothetical protein